jgi:hypothetical protein
VVKDTAAFNSKRQLPQKFDALGWKWEMYRDAIQIPWICNYQHIIAPLMTKTLLKKFNAGLEKSGRNLPSLIACGTMANHLVASTLWFMLTLWANDNNKLDKTQTKIINLVWGGLREKACHLIDKDTICLTSSRLGGQGLLSIPARTSPLASALFGQLILWALEEHDTSSMLSGLLHSFIEEQSMWKWGSRDLSVHRCLSH